MTAPSPVRRPAKDFKFGSIRIPYAEYKRGRYTYFTLFYYDSGRRRLETRSTHAAAKTRASEIAERISRGELQMLRLKEADRASYLRSLDLIAPTKKSLELACSEYGEIWSLCQAAGVSPLEAVREGIASRPKGIKPLAVPDLVIAFLAARQSEGISRRWTKSLESQLAPFATHFTGPLHELTAASLNAWLSGLKIVRIVKGQRQATGQPIGQRTRQNYRNAIGQLANWARDNGHIPRTWCEMDHLPKRKTADVAIKILTPEQLTKLLGSRQTTEAGGRTKATLIPFIALAAFAGIRHEEMNGEKALLDWRDIDLKNRRVYVPKDVAKTGRDRIVPIPDNLAAWLAPYEKRNGPVCDLDTSKAICRAKKKAGLDAGRNQTRNTLRKSFISYRLAQIKNIAQVAEEAGNSPAKIRSNYNRPIPDTEADRWFNIWPTAAEVLQLSLRGLG
jgi:integrase